MIHHWKHRNLPAPDAADAVTVKLVPAVFALTRRSYEATTVEQLPLSVESPVMKMRLFAVTADVFTTSVDTFEPLTAVPTVAFVPVAMLTLLPAVPSVRLPLVTVVLPELTVRPAPRVVSPPATLKVFVPVTVVLPFSETAPELVWKVPVYAEKLKLPAPAAAVRPLPPAIVVSPLSETAPVPVLNV